MEAVTYFNESERMRAATTIEANVMQFSNELGLSVTQCVWNLNLGMNHCGPHRLDVHFGDFVLRIYFTDCELASYWWMQETTRTDDRLSQLIARAYDIIHARQEPDPLEHPYADMSPLPHLGYCHKKSFRRRVK